MAHVDPGPRGTRARLKPKNSKVGANQRWTLEFHYQVLARADSAVPHTLLISQQLQLFTTASASLGREFRTAVSGMQVVGLCINNLS